MDCIWENLKNVGPPFFKFISVFTVPKFAISQSEANSTVLISYDIKSLASYPSISWSLSSKVMLPYDKLQRGFANKQTTRNLRFSWCFAVKKGAKTFPPKLNWKTLANCGPLGITPGRFCYRNAKFWAEFGYGKYLIVPFWYASAAYQARLVSSWVFWLDCVSPKYEPWLRPNSPDMPPKPTKKVRLGIYIKNVPYTAGKSVILQIKDSCSANLTFRALNLQN